MGGGLQWGEGGGWVGVRAMCGRVPGRAGPGGVQGWAGAGAGRADQKYRMLT